MAPLLRNILFLIGAAIAVTAAAQDPSNTSSNPPPTTITVATNSPDLVQGQHLFETQCAVCHGPHGEGGKGPTLAQPNLPRASDEASLLKIISGGINGTEMPAARLTSDEIKLVAQYVKSLSSRPRELVPGAPARGAEIFEKKGGCTQCHQIRGHGGYFGPDLSDAGGRRSADYLRRALVDPGADVPQSYVPWRADVALPENFLYVRLVTREGQDISGVRVNEDTFSIQIRDATGVVHSFFKSELAELHKEFGKSPMPSYATALTKEEINDLVAFLAEQRFEQ
jgi:putative heme-binding domain-containing protein